MSTCLGDSRQIVPSATEPRAPQAVPWNRMPFENCGTEVWKGLPFVRGVPVNAECVCTPLVRGWGYREE